MKRQLLLIMLIQTLALSACGDDTPPDVLGPDAATDASDEDKDDDRDQDKEPEDELCEASLPVVQTVSPREDGQPTNVALCPVEGGVRHLRVEGAKLPPAHASYQIYLGLEEPVGAQDEVPEGALRIMAYGGGVPAPPASLTVRFGGHSVSLTEDVAFITDGTTFCVDIFDGDAGRSPAVVLWVDGHKGASCEERETLSRMSAFAIIDRISDAKGSIAFGRESYFYLAAGLESAPTITLNNETVLTAEDALACAGSAPYTETIALSEGVTTNVALCSVDGGVRHLVVDGLVVPSSGHASAQIYLGLESALGAQDPLPEGALRIMAYGGSFFQLTFGDASESIPEPNFLGDGTPFCLDIFDGDEERSPSVYLWVSGHEGADCADRDTLTADNTFGAVETFGDITGSLALEKDTYFYAAAAVTGSPRVTLDGESALNEADVRP